MKEKIVLKYKKENDLLDQKLTLNDRVDNIFKSDWVNEITYLSNLMQDTRMCLVELQQENKQLTSILTELEKWLKEQLMCFCENNEQGGFSANVEDLEMVLDKIQELKEKYK